MLPVFAKQPVGRELPDGVADDARPQRQRGEDADLDQREVPELDQIRRQPAQEDPQAIDVSEVGAHDRPHVGRAQHDAPRHGRLLADVGFERIALRVGAADVFELVGIDQGVVFGKVAIGEIPQDRPDQADRAADVEHRAPAERRHDQHHQRRRNRRAEPARAVGDALHEAALVLGIPELHGARRAGEGAAFADAEQEAQHHERGRAGRPGRRCGHHRPIGDDDGEHLARAEAVADPAAGNLEQCIGPDEGAEDHAHGDLVEAEFLADGRSRGRDVHAVEISNQVHQADQNQDVPAAHAGPRLWLFHVQDSR